MLKRLLLSIITLAAIFGVAQAVNISGTDSSGEFSVIKVGYIRQSVTDTITAFAGGGQTSATLLDSGYNRVTVVASANDSVKLPSCHSGPSNTGPMPSGVISGNTTGLMLWVTNADSADSMNVFPQTGEFINALTVNSAYAVAANKTVGFLCSPGGSIWYSVLGG
jgi:hypothetical protein